MSDTREPPTYLGTPRRERSYFPAETGARLRAHREAHGMTLRELSAATGDVSVSHLRAIEKGRRAPSLVVARAIIDAMPGLPPDVAAALWNESVPDAGRSRRGWLE